MENKTEYGIVVIPPKDEKSCGIRFVMPIRMKRVFDCYYFKEEQPTYEGAAKELWLSASCIFYHIKQLEKLWLCKIWKRGIIKWTL